MLPVPAPLVAPIVLLYLQARWQVMNEEMTGKCLRQVEHIHGHLWHLKSCTLVYVCWCTLN
jgi:hypothetical protein